jgi:hypothetical protein
MDRRVGLIGAAREEHIRRRSGHESSAFDRYRRVASTLRELHLGDWMPLDQAIPELAAASRARSAAASPENAAAHAAAESEKPTRGTAETSAIPRSRGDWIRTSDPLTPSQVR